MKRWAVIVAILYSLILGVLSLPVTLLAFVPNVSFKEGAGTYAQWQWWLLLALMGLAQAALLAVPVRMASRRPITRRPLALTVMVAALMMGGLVVGAFCSLYEFALGDKAGEPKYSDWAGWTALALGVAAWCAWGLIFFRLSRRAEPEDLVSRLCKCLLKGSILELLIAVPTHIVARCRDYCCAGFMTFVGLTLGMSVMLFSFGPGVFFLFAARWRRLHPGHDADRGERFSGEC
jgi:MFS family permease